MSPGDDPILLHEEVWHPRRAAHVARVSAWLEPHLARAARGEKHAVYDFLFDYYAFRPSWLRRWHPGVGYVLAGASANEFLAQKGYRPAAGGVSADPSTLPAHRIDTVRWLHALLAGIQERPASFGCFGLHEWAMVYRLPPEQVRHLSCPLRFPPEEIARILESQVVCCSHYDAFRFFTPDARPLNRLQPDRESIPVLEQRGCLHANMDLYKWATKLVPFTPAELVADTFDLALRIRELDMRASPYDIRHLGFEPICIETPAGRQDYESRQRGFAREAEPLRARLMNVCGAILAHVDPKGP